MNSLISHNIKHRTTPKDVFYTPELVVKTHIQSISSQDSDIWLDPFAGKKIYYDNFPTSLKDYCEIEEGTDFFEYTPPYQIDVICSNPPYSNLDDVLKKSVELNPRVISYLLLEGKMTPKRIEYMNHNGYTLSGMYMCKVYKWYGMAVAYTFTKGVVDNKVDFIFDRIVHK
jgi:hypothetical protein